MKDFLNEAAEFTGRACGIIARDLADISKPLAESFVRGWQAAWEEEAKASPEAQAQTPETA